MRDRYVLTPYFLDEPLHEVEILAGPGAFLNNIDLPSGDQQDRMSAVHAGIADQVEKTVRAGKRPVSVAGDCCTAIGVAAGLKRTGLDPFLIWFDAHGDFNTWETTPSGFLGGMPLAMLVGRGDQRMLRAVVLDPIPEEKVILTDGRDLDHQERDLLVESKIHHLPDTASLADMNLPEESLYVHFDVDVVNPLDVSAVSYSANGGPRSVDLGKIFDRLAATGRIAAVSMSIWNPELDEEDRSRKVCMSLLDRLLGKPE